MLTCPISPMGKCRHSSVAKKPLEKETATKPKSFYGLKKNSEQILPHHIQACSAMFYRMLTISRKLFWWYQHRLKSLILPTPQTLHSDKICSNSRMAADMFAIGRFCNPKRSSISRAWFALQMAKITFWGSSCLSTNQDKALHAVILAEMHPHPAGTHRWFPWARLQVGDRRTAVTALGAALQLLFSLHYLISGTSNNYY